MGGHQHLTKTLVLSNPSPHLLARNGWPLETRTRRLSDRRYYSHHFVEAVGFNEHSFCWKVQIYSDLLKIDLIPLQFPRALPGSPQPNSPRRSPGTFQQYNFQLNSYFLLTANFCIELLSTREVPALPGPCQDSAGLKTQKGRLNSSRSLSDALSTKYASPVKSSGVPDLVLFVSMSILQIKSECFGPVWGGVSL